MEQDRKYMEQAVHAARNSVAEDGTPRPKVGVVIVGKDGTEFGAAYRGKLGPGEHAEYTLLERLLGPAELNGATVYVTLEPCTTRNHPKVPCAERLVERHVARVVIGMLDPNPNILGRGVLHLRRARIAVEFFPADLMATLEEMNRDFIRLHSASLAPAITDQLLDLLAQRTLDQWYVSLNQVYWNRNFHRDPAAIFVHLVEVLGSLSVLVSKKKIKGAPVQKTIAKVLAWWMALCGKVGVKSVEELIWGKFPLVCPYCELRAHSSDQCKNRRSPATPGPNWPRLKEIAAANLAAMPKTIGGWQRMFAQIYPPSDTDDTSKIFAKLTEEVGELAETIRVFPAAPGYFLSEAADVFAWLMKLNNMIDEEAEVAPDKRGDALQREFVSAYPSRCVDCNSGICTCPPILASTVGRIAHEVSPERASFGEHGSFMTQEKAAQQFGPRSPIPGV